MPASVTALIDSFARLPGVGPKTASRLTYFLLRAPTEVAETLSHAILELKQKTRLCNVCFNITEEDTCEICKDAQRDSSIIAVVEEPLDVLALERAGNFNGRYHVLHGVISPRDGIGPEQLKIRELIKRVHEGAVQELIISTNPGMEGDATAMTIKHELDKLGKEVKLTRLARGLPTGADLEYADAMTVMKALQGRQPL
ncbi:MAG: recombination mediator RecR [Anaerolineae bacterium]|nr:recombination mediator RecR [Anaerolineae bacterium]